VGEGVGPINGSAGDASRPGVAPALLYLDGRVMRLSEGTVSVEDRGLQLGDGVYEVVKVENGRLLWLDDHLERLVWSLTQILLPDALDGHRLGLILPDLVRRSGVHRGTAYVQVTRGRATRDFEFPEGTAPTVMAYVQEHGFPSEDEILAGVALHAVEDPRWARCDIKSTNLLPAVLAKNVARRHGAEEVLYVSADGTVREGGSSNVFAVVDGVLRTHPADNRILNGITRCHVLELARENGLPVREEALDVADLRRAEEVFIASTTRDVMPVIRVSGLDAPAPAADLSAGPAAGPPGDAGKGTIHPGAGRPGRVTLLLADAMRTLVSRSVGAPPPSPLAG
jgi:D-alanine transaminase